MPMEKQREKIDEFTLLPAVHTISVVMSPNGLMRPPALAATTTLMPWAREALFLLSMVSKTVDKIKAVGQIIRDW